MTCFISLLFRVVSLSLSLTLSLCFSFLVCIFFVNVAGRFTQPSFILIASVIFQLFEFLTVKNNNYYDRKEARRRSSGGGTQGGQNVNKIDRPYILFSTVYNNLMVHQPFNI